MAKAQATTYTVNTGGEVSSVGVLTLRRAIAMASGGDTINFAPSVTVITLTDGELYIDKGITITGPGAAQLTVQRSGAPSIPYFRIFNIASGSFSVAISDLTIAGGVADELEGGGIQNLSTLTITRCVIAGNVSHANFNIAGGGLGGGIFNDGNLTIISSTISGNNALAGGSVFSKNFASILNSTVSDNTAAYGAGGIGALVS